MKEVQSLRVQVELTKSSIQQIQSERESEIEKFKLNISNESDIFEENVKAKGM